MGWRRVRKKSKRTKKRRQKGGFFKGLALGTAALAAVPLLAGGYMAYRAGR